MRTRPPPTQFLPNAIGDPKRRSGESRIRPPVDILVYAEGYVDRDLLQLASRRGRIKVVLPPQHKPYIGKLGILQLLSENDQNGYAVLDMDHDFSGHLIEKYPNIKDTRAKCCLLSFLLGDKTLVAASDFLSRYLFPKDTEKSERFKNALTENWAFLEMVAMERTSARLFRGKFHNSNKINLGRRGELPTLSEIFKYKRKCIRDLISPHNDEHYLAFKKKYAEKLKLAGVNDHALEEVLIPFIAHFEPDLTSRYIKSKFNKAVEEFLIYSKAYEKGAILLP